MRAAIYARQSLSHQEGIDRQVSRCEAMASIRHYEVIDTYKDDDVSASKSRASAEWSRLLNDAKSGRFDVIVAVDLDRMIRSQADLLDLIDTKAALLTVDGEIDLTTAEGEFRASMLASLARFEVKKKSERQKRANEHKIASGKPAAGKRRYGYKPGNMEVREDEAEILRGIYAGLLEGKSIRSMATDLTNRGVPFRDKLVTWYPVRLRDMMNNPAYYGCIIVKGEAIRSKLVQPLIDKETWDMAQVILNDPTRKTNPGRPRTHLLSGLMTCGTCGLLMRFTNNSYCCTTPITGHPVMRGTFLDAQIIDEVALAFVFGPTSLLASQSGDEYPEPIRIELAAIEAETQQLQEDRSEGLLSPEVVRKSLLALKARREPLEERLEGILMRQGARGVLADIAGKVVRRSEVSGKVSLTDSDVTGAKEKLKEAFAELSLDAKRDLIAGLMDITVYPGRGAKRVKVVHKIAVGLNED